MMRTLGSGSLPEVLGGLFDAQVVAGAVRLSGRSGTAEDLLPKYLATWWLQATDGAVTATILAAGSSVQWTLGDPKDLVFYSRQFLAAASQVLFFATE